MNWSVVTACKDGYAMSVDTLASKEGATGYATGEVGNVYIVRGTQLYNKSLGRIEERDGYSSSVRKVNNA